MILLFQAACLLGQLSVKAAVTVKDTVQKKIEEERKKKSPQSSPSSPNDVKNVRDFEKAMNEAKFFQETNKASVKKNIRSEHYVSDDETLSYDDR